MASPSKLAIVAGAGDIPALMAQLAEADGWAVHVVALKDLADPEFVACYPHVWVGLAQGAPFLNFMRAHDVQKILMVGKVPRPTLRTLRADWRGAKFLAKISLKALGDNALLSAVKSELEGEGLDILGVEDITKTLQADVGCLTVANPNEQSLNDIKQGMVAARTLGELDIGQAVVVHDGRVLAVEGAEGTEGLITRVPALRDVPAGGVLVKAVKPQQDRRLDLPMVGAETIRQAAKASLDGVAIQANGVVMIGRDATIEAANREGLFLYAAA